MQQHKKGIRSIFLKSRINTLLGGYTNGRMTYKELLFNMQSLIDSEIAKETAKNQ